MSQKGAAFQLALNNQNDVIDYTLTGNPTRNYFQNQSFSSFQNFSSYQSVIPLSGTQRFNQTLTAKITPKDGDILKKVYLQFELPALTASSGTYACWTNTIGYAIIDYISYKIGEDLIIKKYAEELELDWYFDKPLDTEYNKNLLVGKYIDLNALKQNALTNKTYTVPILLPFSDSIYTALPIGLLSNQDIIIEVKLKSFDEVINYDGNTPPQLTELVSMQLLADFSMLDNNTKIMFNLAQKQDNPWKLMNVVSQTEYHSAQNKIITTFSGPIKMVYILFRHRDSKANNDYFNYSNRNNLTGQPIISNISYTFQGQNIIETTSEQSLRLLNSYNKLYPTNRYIYPIIFSEQPLQYQPSGYYKLNSVSEQELNITFPEGVNTNDIEVIVIAKSYTYSQILNYIHSILF